MRRVTVVGLGLPLALILLSACAESDPAPPGIDGGMDASEAGLDAEIDAELDAAQDSGNDSAIDSGNTMDAALDAALDDDAMVAECDGHNDCDDGLACTLDRCVDNACVVSAPDLDGDNHADMTCVDANGDPLGDDCNDDSPTVHLGAAELCDGSDNDCDAFIDEQLVSVAWYPDLDGDLFGDASGTAIEACAPVSGHSTLATDCDDNNNAVHPGSTELCDTIDNDCNSVVDDSESCRGTRVTYLKSDGTDALDGLGASVALSGDTLVVGAPGLDVGGARSGGAFVFVRAGDVWTQQARLTADNAEANDELGTSVAIDGDTIVVGAPFESSNATGVGGDGDDNSAAASGAAYVFVRSGSTWTQQAYLKANNTEAQDKLGFSVAIAGDTIAVGAHQEDSSASGIDGDDSDNGTTDSGAVYVFTRSNDVWSQHAYLKAASATAGDGFGYSVAINLDSLIVGAPYRGSSRGAAYVFLRSSSVWTQERYLSPMTLQPGDSLGISVAVSGDTFVVGVPYEDSNATGVGGDELDNSLVDSGAVQIFQRGGANWLRRYAKASHPGAGDHFGWSVAIDNDSVLIGAPEEDSDATGIDGDQTNDDASGSGASYLFLRASGVWSQRVYLKPATVDAGDNFGTSVTLDGDTLAISAPAEDSGATGVNGDAIDNSATDSGAVHVFR